MLATNVIHFTRILRDAGLPLGTRSALDALACVEVAGIETRQDLRAALRCVLVSRADHLLLFDTAFDLFWRDPDINAKMMAALLPEVSGRGTATPPPPPPMRLLDAMHGQQKQAQVPQPTQEPDQLEFDATLTFSASEKFQRLDFEGMSADEWALAKNAIRDFALPVKPIRTRRHRPVNRGQSIDLRRTLRETVRTGGELIHLMRKAPEVKAPPLVVLCDISGSMHRYTRMFLHFIHALTNDTNAAQHVEVFLFGTRLTHITRQLRHKDVDAALARVASAAPDWSGGTRIGASLREFNQRWSRRLLGQGAVVLLLTDGLDRDDIGVLAASAERLRKSCRQLIWLNPLLRFDAFAPRAAGIQVLLPHASKFIPAHNLQSIKSLATALSAA
jgi:uncharacterized protein with von Willebrand factor type A (vWA) domain